MLFSFPVLLTAVFLFDLEILIRAVVVKDLLIPLSQEMAVLIDFRLDHLAFSTKDIQCAVYIMELIGRPLQEL